jgi:hypothetical protein
MGLFSIFKSKKKEAVVAIGGLEAAANYTRDRSILCITKTLESAWDI